MTEAQEGLRDILVDLWEQGYRPPYRLTISDGEGQSIAFDVTMTIEIKHEVLPPQTS